MSIRMLVAVALFAVAPAQAERLFGSAMPEGNALPLAQALTDPASFGEPARKFSGRVTEVCQKKGCWLMLEDDGRAARVMIQDHGFAIPVDASGQATVYGVLGSKDLSPDAALHLAEDAGRSEAKAGPEFRITAYAVVLQEG